MLSHHLQPFMDFAYPNVNELFQGDNFAYHWAYIPRYLFDQHFGQFQPITWTPRSSDVKPVENM